MKPQLVQNGSDIQKPKKHKVKATNILGYFIPICVSQITVDVASTIENAESIPSRDFLLKKPSSVQDNQIHKIGCNWL